jgi:hypothetical protein
MWVARSWKTAQQFFSHPEENRQRTRNSSTNPGALSHWRYVTYKKNPALRAFAHAVRCLFAGCNRLFGVVDQRGTDLVFHLSYTGRWLVTKAARSAGVSWVAVTQGRDFQRATVGFRRALRAITTSCLPASMAAMSHDGAVSLRSGHQCLLLTRQNQRVVDVLHHYVLRVCRVVQLGGGEDRHRFPGVHRAGGNAGCASAKLIWVGLAQRGEGVQNRVSPPRGSGPFMSAGVLSQLGLLISR